MSDLDAAPVLEAGVELGAGAVILGRVRIGAGARIGANAVVLGDVPAGALALGCAGADLDEEIAQIQKKMPPGIKRRELNVKWSVPQNALGRYLFFPEFRSR